MQRNGAANTANSLKYVAVALGTAGVGTAALFLSFCTLLATVVVVGAAVYKLFGMRTE